MSTKERLIIGNLLILFQSFRLEPITVFLVFLIQTDLDVTDNLLYFSPQAAALQFVVLLANQQDQKLARKEQHDHRVVNHEDEDDKD